MNGQLFNRDWAFYRTEADADAEQVWGKWEKFTPVDIPHDWLIYDAKNLYQDGTGWYHKRFAVDRKPGEHVFLRFDGVYMDSTVYLNGKKVKEWKYGYSTFDVDLTDGLTEGENDLLVQVVFKSPNSRWYSGAGIYRNVWIRVCPQTYLVPDGTYVTIREQEAERWEMCISTEVAGAASGSAEAVSGEAAGCLTSGSICRYRLLHEGKCVQELGQAAVSAEGRAELMATVEKPFLWDVQEPNCYQLAVELCAEASAAGNGMCAGASAENGAALSAENGTCAGASAAELHIIDRDEVTVGFRTLEFTTDRGFFLNHRPLKIHGVCEHHDLGCLGSAFNKAAFRRRLLILRKMGVNALRTSHNMPAPGLMELADEMGFLVMDEAFDMWELPKTEYDYARFFIDWAERDIESFVRRDRNHPCLFLWSIGNEIYDTHAGEHGQEITKRLMGYVRAHDPRGNANITIASNYMPWENAQKCADLVKYAGYNYGESCYEEHHEAHPDWVIYGSETASIVQSRGVYHFPLRQPCLSEVDEQCSALGNSNTSWGAQDLEKLIGEDRDCTFSFGQFLWTGFDYIGEPTPYHTKNSYFGQIDTAGFPKDAYYVFQSDWVSAEENPMVHLFPYWDWNEGQLVDVLACSNGDSVELFVNGESRGRQALSHRKGSTLLAKWQVVYEPGEILAVAYDREGKELARESRHSFGDSHQVVLSADRTILAADGEDVCFVEIGMADGASYPVENAMDYVTMHVEGPGRLLGLDNGDSTDYDQYKTNCRKLFNGKLCAVIGTCAEAGEIKVRVEACDGEILGACLVLQAKEALVRDGVCCAEDCDEAPAALGGNEEGSGHCGAGSSVSIETVGTKMCGGNVGARIPARKAELRAEAEAGKHLLTPDRAKVLVKAKLYPANTTDTDLKWEAVNDAGIPLGYVKVTPGEDHTAWVEAFGDGAFRVRCQGMDGEGKVRLLSQLEFAAEGFGKAFFDPYTFLSAGLYTRMLGEVTNGNEKGIATGRSGKSGVLFERVDFGAFGSDTITMGIFSLNDEPYEIEVWEGAPEAEGSRLIDTVVYRKTPIWNVYQDETWKLPERFRGVADIAFVVDGKLHFKGFVFERQEKAFQKLTGADASKVYGDSFSREGSLIRDIGNNVTVVYEDMDFGEGADRVTIWGHTPLPVNTIHLLFTGTDGRQSRVIVEYPGGGNAEEGEYTFPVEGFCGKGKLELVFLPGSDFTLEAIQFHS